MSETRGQCSVVSVKTFLKKPLSLSHIQETVLFLCCSFFVVLSLLLSFVTGMLDAKMAENRPCVSLDKLHIVLNFYPTQSRLRSQS